MVIIDQIPENYFQNKVVLITGGSRGIGFATAKLFGEQNAKIAIFSKNEESLNEAQEELNNYAPEVFAGLVDVRDYGEVERFVKETLREFGQIDILVNNAGVAWMGDFVDEDKENIDEIIDVNVKGVLYTSRIVLPQMIKQKRGLIINISSGAGLKGIPLLTTYCSSKFAVVGFTQALADEVDRFNIRVYAICPAAVATDMQKAISGQKIGIPSTIVARKIMAVAGPNPPINSGECLVVYQ